MDWIAVCRSRFILVTLTSSIVLSGFASAEWYRGNTHVHTVLCGHADSTPEAVTKWYHDRGYNSLVLSEHNRFIDPRTVQMPENLRSDFILVPGEEVTGEFSIHTTAMNIRNLVSWQDEGETDKAKVISNHVHRTRQAGGHAILNHPNGKSSLDAHHVLPATGLRMMEVYNANNKRNNLFKRRYLNNTLTAEGLWDELLSGGMLVYGVASDDAHTFQKTGPNESIPGLGWVMVQADELTADAITEAMRSGKFYASSGVHLRRCEAEANAYKVVVDKRKTRNELASLPSWSGMRVKKGTEGYRIDYFGPNGKVLKTFRSGEAVFSLPESHSYMRARVTLTLFDSERGFEEFYAWGQPVLQDH